VTNMGYQKLLVAAAKSIPDCLQQSAAGGLLDMQKVRRLMQGHVSNAEKACRIFTVDVNRGLR